MCMKFGAKNTCTKKHFQKGNKSKDFDIHCTQKNNGRILKSLDFNILPFFFSEYIAK